MCTKLCVCKTDSEHWYNFEEEFNTTLCFSWLFNWCAILLQLKSILFHVKREYVHFISVYSTCIYTNKSQWRIETFREMKTKLNGPYYIRTVVYKLKCLIKFQHSLLGKYFVAFIFNFLFHFISGNIYMKMCPVCLNDNKLKDPS